MSNSYLPKSAENITTSDTLANNFTGIYVGVAGDVKIETPTGDIVTFTAVPAGKDIPIPTVKVFATLTTATNLVGYKRV